VPFSAAVALGKVYAKTRDEKILRILKKMAGDDRWRIREAVAFGFQRIGEDDFSEVKRIFSEGIAESGNREKRAILCFPCSSKDSRQRYHFVLFRNPGKCF